MSVLYCNNDNYLLDHKKYFSNIYKKVQLEDGTVSNFTLSPKLFHIKGKKSEKSNKRPFKSDDIIAESSMVKQKYSDFNQIIPNPIRDKLNKVNISYDTDTIRKYSQQIFESTKFNHSSINGANNSNNPLKCLIMDEYFLIPPKSRFLCGCVKEECEKLKGSKFDIVVADPPWWNKYIRRLKRANDKMSYSMMYNEDIASIPIKELLADNCLLAIWCTNSSSNIDAVKNIIFPKWGVKYLATWYWLKVTIDLDPICNFSGGSGKQPYERVIIGCVGDLHVPDKLLFASVPSALHSHKPPLLDLLRVYMSYEEPVVLELFARYLLPTTTSVGHEPLKWQHASLYNVAS